MPTPLPDYLVVAGAASSRNSGDLRLTLERKAGTGRVDRLAVALPLDQEQALLQALLDRAHHRGESIDCDREPA